MTFTPIVAAAVPFVSGPSAAPDAAAATVGGILQEDGMRGNVGM